MSNPLVYDGLVIVGIGDRVWYRGDSEHPAIQGTTENALVGLDARTGAPRWHLRLMGSGMPTAGIVSGALIQHDGSGDISEIDPATGVVLQKRNAHTIATMSAILGVGGDRFVTAGMFPSEVQEWSAGPLRKLWVTPVTDRGAGVGDCPPATDGQLIFCDYTAPPNATEQASVGGIGAQRVYAIDIETGELVWEVPLESGSIPEYNNAAIPLVYAQHIFVGSAVAPYVHALETKDGKLQWRLRVLGPVKGGIAQKAGTLYFGDGAGYLWAVEALTGRVIGVKNAHTIFNVGSPVIDGDTLIVGTKTGSVLAIPLDVIRASHDA